MPKRGRKLLLDKLLKGDANQTERVASALLQGNPNNRSIYLKGVHNGRFHRTKLINGPIQEHAKHSLPQLPGDGAFPRAFRSVGNKAVRNKEPPREISRTLKNKKLLKLPALFKVGASSYEEMVAYIKLWWKQNWSTVVLNFGSVCTLVGFTRSDVLELRCLSVTGSTANVIYHSAQKPVRYLPVVWSALFATVNSFKIREIVLERHQNVHMTPEQEDIFIQFFMPHGITPRQFQILQGSAKAILIPPGEAIIKQGEECNHVSLVVSGSTRASISGRRLTAASSIAPKSFAEEKAGGNSGAWIGKFAVLFCVLFILFCCLIIILVIIYDITQAK